MRRIYQTICPLNVCHTLSDRVMCFCLRFVLFSSFLSFSFFILLCFVLYSFFFRLFFYADIFLKYFVFSFIFIIVIISLHNTRYSETYLIKIVPYNITARYLHISHVIIHFLKPINYDCPPLPVC